MIIYLGYPIPMVLRSMWKIIGVRWTTARAASPIVNNNQKHHSKLPDFLLHTAEQAHTHPVASLGAQSFCKAREPSAFVCSEPHPRYCTC